MLVRGNITCIRHMHRKTLRLHVHARKGHHPRSRPAPAYTCSALDGDRWSRPVSPCSMRTCRSASDTRRWTGVETRHCLLRRARIRCRRPRFIRDVSEDWSPAQAAGALLENLGSWSPNSSQRLVHAFAAAGARTGVPASADRYGSDSYGSDSTTPTPTRRSASAYPRLCETGENGVERVVFAVADPSAAAPWPPRRSSRGRTVGLCESGRGMTLVEALADDWGWRRCAAGRLEPRAKWSGAVRVGLLNQAAELARRRTPTRRTGLASGRFAVFRSVLSRTRRCRGPVRLTPVPRGLIGTKLPVLARI